MSALPPLVRLTPASRRLAQSLVLRADGDLKLDSHPRRAGLADLDPRANRGDPDTAPEETQSRAGHPLAAIAKEGRPSGPSPADSGGT